MPGLCLAVWVCLTDAAYAQDTIPPADTTVTIKGKKPKVVRKIDRTVYDKSDDPAAQSGSAADVLKTVPAVTVSPTGDVALRGDQTVQVYVDGKPSAMMAGDSRAVTLQAMAGSDIASIEVITNPSAKFGGDGGGIINIVLKKNRKPGLNGMLIANSSDHGRSNFNLSGDYSHGKLSLHGRIGMRHDGVNRSNGSDLVWHDPISGAQGRNTQSSRNFARRRSWSTSAGLDYDFDDKDTLSLSGSYAERHSANPLDEIHHDYDGSGMLSDAYIRRSNGPRRQTDTTLSAIFDHHAADSRELKLQVQHSQTIADADKSYRNLFSYPVEPDSRDRVLSRSAKRLDELSLDYVQPLGDTVQVSAGIDLRGEQNRFYNYRSTLDATTADRFTVDQAAAAVYVTWQFAAGKWTWLGGLRTETLRTQSTGPTGSYGNLNPSLHLSYALDSDHQLKASFSRSLQRPDPRDLNTFQVYVDAQNVTAGNPMLKPQRVQAVEAEYDAPGFSVTLYDRSSDHTVTDDSRLLPGNILLTTKRNSGKGRSIGIDASGNAKSGENLEFSYDLNIYHADLQSADLHGLSHASGLSWSAQFGVDYSRGADTFSLDSEAQGPSLTSQGRRSGTSAINMTWKRRITSRLSLNITANDVFAGSYQTFTTDNATVHLGGYSDFRNRQIFIGLSWKLGGN